jgi:hypothetical protein
LNSIGKTTMLRLAQTIAANLEEKGYRLRAPLEQADLDAGMLLIDVGMGTPPYLSLWAEEGDEDVDVHLDRGAGVDVREALFQLSDDRWMANAAAFVAAYLRDYRIEPAGGGA